MATPVTLNSPSESFLPNFCSQRAVLSVVITGEILAIILTLSQMQPNSQAIWGTLGEFSLFIQWLGLSSASILCIIRRTLRIKDSQIVVVSYFILLCNTLLFTELTYLALEASGLLSSAYTELNHQRFLLHTLLIGAIIYALLLGYLYMHHQHQQQIKVEAEMRFQLLQARIRPHFLFNTMNSIACLIHDAPDKAESAIEDLAELLRATLKEQDNYITLEQELTLCRRYLEIEKLRLGERLEISWQLDTTQTLLPPLLIQPLMENAVYHGIEPATQGGRIEITSKEQDEEIILTIRNPYHENPQGRKGHQLALHNIQQRLQLAYGGNASLQQKVDDDHYLIELRLPIVQEQQ